MEQRRRRRFLSSVVLGGFMVQFCQVLVFGSGKYEGRFRFGLEYPAHYHRAPLAFSHHIRRTSTNLAIRQSPMGIVKSSPCIIGRNPRYISLHQIIPATKRVSHQLISRRQQDLAKLTTRPGQRMQRVQIHTARELFSYPAISLG